MKDISEVATESSFVLKMINSSRFKTLACASLVVGAGAGIWYLSRQLNSVLSRLDAASNKNMDEANTALKETSHGDEVKDERNTYKIKGFGMKNNNNLVFQNNLKNNNATRMDTTLNMNNNVINISQAESILNEDVCSLENVKISLLEFIAIQDRISSEKKLLCIYGQPCTGKTFLIKSLAKALHRECISLSLDNIKSVSNLKRNNKRQNEPFFDNTTPHILEAMANALKQANTENPLLLVKDLDSLLIENRVDMLEDFLNLIENDEPLSGLHDDSINLSTILFVFETADIEKLAKYKRIVRKFHVITIPRYSPKEKLDIAQKCLIPQVKEALGITEYRFKSSKRTDKNTIHISDSAIQALLDNYCHEPGVKLLKEMILRAFKRALLIHRDNEGNIADVNIDEKNLETYVGTPDVEEMHTKPIKLSEMDTKIEMYYNMLMTKEEIPKEVYRLIEEQLAILKEFHKNQNTLQCKIRADYLFCLIKGVPWSVLDKESLDLNSIEEVLNNEVYGLSKAKTSILEYLAVDHLQRRENKKVLCLVGPPGCGKTRLASSLAQALNRKFGQFTVDAISDAGKLHGYSIQTYVSDSKPGAAIQSLIDCQSMNPLIAVDDIDKIPENVVRGNPRNSLLQILDPEKNNTFYDQYINTPVDLSKVFFVCTSSNLLNIPKIIKEQLYVIDLSEGYTTEEKISIVKTHFIPEMLKVFENAKLERLGQKHSIAVKDDLITEGAIKTLIERNSQDKGMGSLKFQIEKVFYKGIFLCVKENMKELGITNENLEALLGGATPDQKQTSSGPIVEVGERRKPKSEIAMEKYHAQLANKNVPAKIKETIESEFSKARNTEKGSSEYDTIMRYLDWLTIMPWGLSSEENNNIEDAYAILNKDHYGLEEVKKSVLEFIAVTQLRKSSQGKILCLCGPPGVGKTSIAKSIANALGREYFQFSVGGLDDVNELKGHRRTYIGSMPGKAAQALKITKTENPLILIDEIDKIGRGWKGDPAAAMLEMLDPQQNNAYLDHYLDVPIDLSKVLFVCTANTTDTISRPLLDRLDVIELSGYVAEEKLEIAQKYLLPQISELTGLMVPTKDKQGDISIANNVLEALIDSYCRESGVRNLRRHIEKIFRSVALERTMKIQKEARIPLKENQEALGQCLDKIENSIKQKHTESVDASSNNNITKGNKICEKVDQMKTILQELTSDCSISGDIILPPIEINTSNMETYVGKPKYLKDRMYDTTPPGVCIALAYTSNGGKALYIETMKINQTKKKNKEAQNNSFADGGEEDSAGDGIIHNGECGGIVRCTGNLGKVLKESVQIAFTYAKTFLDTDADPGNDFLHNNSIHLHVPEGATPKDGPSAGCAIVTATLSLAMGRQVRQDLAMTGEISLNGKVLQIGGIREKVMAAKRMKITHLVLPELNKDDFEQLPESVRKGITAHFADTYEDVFRIAFQSHDHNEDFKKSTETLASTALDNTVDDGKINEITQS